MDVTIALSPFEESQLCLKARQLGLPPTELIKRWITENPPAMTPEEKVAAKLREWQEPDKAFLAPEIPAQVLFAQWAEEDALMTDEEKEEADRLWERFEKRINETRSTLGMRLL